MTETVHLPVEESFCTYHLVCTYLTGDPPPPRKATKEDARDVAARIRTGPVFDPWGLLHDLLRRTQRLRVRAEKQVIDVLL